MTMADLLLRLRALFFRARVEQELDDEVEFHLAMAQRKHRAAGLTEEEASRLARLDFGRVGAVKEDCRGARGIDTYETTMQDVRYALASFRRSPGFVLTVSGTIALGLGLNAALFTLFNAYVLRPVSIHDPYSLYSLAWTDRTGRGHAFSWDEYRQLEKDHPAFSEVAAVQYVITRLDGRVLQGQLVTGNYFQMLGVGTVLGRPLLPEDAAEPGRDPVIVLSYQAWKDVFGGRPDIVGTKVAIRGYPMEVIGVARQGFQDLSEVPRDFWAPLTMAPLLQSGLDLFGSEHPEGLAIIGRLRSGMSLSQAKAILETWTRQLTAQLPEERRAIGIELNSKATSIPLTPELLIMFSPLAAAFGLVLVLACTNVASMMLARATARQREIGIRLSLGAVRGRLIRQLLTESVLLSIPAAVMGFVFSRITIESAIRTMYATVPKDMLELVHDVAHPVDWRVLLFMILAALVSALLFGLAPAIQATRANVMAAVRGELTADVRPVRVRNALVIAQITVCTLLLVACGVLVRTTMAMTGFDIGFRTGNVIAMEIVESGRRRVLEALNSDPGIEKVAAASSVPLGGLVPDLNISAERRPAITTAYNQVSPEYFEILGIPIVRGRNFSSQEAASESPVGILSAATAERLFPEENAIGQVLRVSGKLAQEVRIIGIASDIVTCCIPYGKDAAMLYLPIMPSGKANVLVRVRGDVEGERTRLDARFATLAPGAIADIHSLDQYRAAGIYPFRAAAVIGAALGVLALLLTVSGIYGVISYFVTQRTREFGIRIALGATKHAVIGLVMKQSLRLSAIGVGVGAVLAVGLCKLLTSQLVFMRLFDGAAFSAGILLAVSASLAAGYIPCRRATQIDPIETLRYD
jgi:predicted permease